MRSRLNIAEAAGAGILAIAVVGLCLAATGYAFSDFEQLLVAGFAMPIDLIWQLRRASAMSARSGETEGLAPKDASAVPPAADAQGLNP